MSNRTRDERARTKSEQNLDAPGRTRTHPNESEWTTRQTMGEISHTHPFTHTTFGEVYRRGPAVADGGETRPGVGAEGPARKETMRDVDHTPRHGEATNEVWKRGGEAVPNEPSPVEDADDR